jgi:hypothetical protein
MKRKKKSIKDLVAQSSPRIPKHEVDEIGDRVWKNIQAAMDKQDLSLRSLYGDGWNAPPLEQHDLQLLTAAKLLAGEGTAESISRTAEKWGGLAAPFLALERLVAEGLLVSLGTPGQQRHFQVTEIGERALGRAKAEGKQLLNPREGLAEAKESTTVQLEDECPDKLPS